MAYTEPVRTQRTAMAFVLEDTYGHVTVDIVDQTDQLAIYDAFNPITPDISVIQLNRARSTLGRDGIAAGRAIYTLAGKLFVYNPGVYSAPGASGVLAAAKWLDLLRCCGYRRFNVTGTAPTLTSVTPGGTLKVLPAGGYYYAIATVDDNVAPTPYVHSLLSTPQLGTVTLGEENVLAWPTPAGSGKTTYVYRGLVGGGTPDASDPTKRLYFLADAGTDATSYTDTGAIDAMSLGFPAPDATTISANDYGGILFTPISESHDSAKIAVWLNSYKHIATGVRGTMSFKATAGQPVEANFDLRGLYSDATVTANPTLVGNPCMPRKFESAQAFIMPMTSGVTPVAFTPILRDLQYNIGSTPQERLDANAANSVTELGIVQQFDPHIVLQVEVNTGWQQGTSPKVNSVDPIADMKTGQFYVLGATFGSTATPANDLGKRIRLDAVHAQLSKAPTYNDQTGYRCWELDFVLTGANDWSSIYVH